MIEPSFFSMAKDFRYISIRDILVFKLGQLPDLTNKLGFAPLLN